MQIFVLYTIKITKINQSSFDYKSEEMHFVIYSKVKTYDDIT